MLTEIAEYACRKCGGAFSKPRLHIERNGYKCPDCINFSMRKYVAENKGKSKYRKERPQHPRADRREQINKMKSAPCVDCQTQFKPHQMDFDHVRGPKLFEISKAARSGTYSLEAILEEIAKCELVCSNCHRDRTHQRKYQNSGRNRLH
jgi:hypothetical protein